MTIARSIVPSIVIEGRGLHRGLASRVTITGVDAVTTIAVGDEVGAIADLAFFAVDRATVARWPSGAEVETIEHLLAAIAGLGAFAGLAIVIDGDELPILDGGASRWCEAIASVRRSIASIAPIASKATSGHARVARSATIEIEEAAYSFAPSDSTSIVAHVDYPASRFGVALSGSARWDGDAAHFIREIAPSRTFGAARELAALRASGRGAHLPEGSVVALDVDDARYAPRDPAEPIRHKLLDLIGDVASLGAPFVGGVEAHRPSHRATHAALAIARADGTIVVER